MTPSSPSELIVSFYDPDIQAEDRYGRSLKDVLSWDNRKLENCHNYVQLLFPLPEGSMFNWDAPVIDLDIMMEFRSSSELQGQLRKSLERMLSFYGFAVSASAEANSEAAVITEKAADDAQTEETSNAGLTPISPSDTSSASQPAYTIIRSPQFPTFSRNWAVRRDHNHLRITRILRCLRVLGLQQECNAFYQALKEVYEDPAIRISDDSMMYWTRAVQRPLHIAPDGARCAWLEKWEKEQNDAGIESEE